MSSSALPSSSPTFNNSSSSGFSDLISEPYYTPLSPRDYTEDDIPDIPQIKYRIRKRDRNPLPKFPPSINEFTSQSDIAVEILEKQKQPPAPKEKRKRKNKHKELAEDLFDIKAKPKSLVEFFNDVKEETVLPDISLFEKENLSIEIENDLEDPVIHEEMAMACLVAAKHNSNKQLDLNYGLKLPFDDKIEKEYLRNLELDPEYYDLTFLEFKASYDKIYDRELFIQRRLFDCLHHLQFSDENFLKRHLPVKHDISRVDVTKLFNDDDNSICIIKSKFKDAFKICTTTKDLIQRNGEMNMKVLANKLIFKKYRRFQNYLIAGYILFNDPKQLKRRTTKVRDLHNIFKMSMFQNSDIKTVFNSIGIGFFGDYCNFNVIKPYIANLSKDRHKKRLKTLKKEKVTEAKKRKKLDVQESDLWFDTNDQFFDLLI